MPGSRNDRVIIRIEGASRSFGALAAVSPITLNIQSGITCGLVGSDGAGKTTLLRMIGAMIRPTKGRILVDGLDTASQRHRLKDVIGYMPQRFGLYHDLTVGENIDFFMDIYGVRGEERRRRREHYLGFSHLLPFIGRRAGNLSGGMKQKLGLACVLVHQPKVLILDEPTNGVDPVSRQEFWNILGQMKREGMTILVSTAYLDEGEHCDQIVLMHRSQVLESGPPEAVRSGHPSLEDAMVRRIEQVDQGLAHEGFKA
jgi:ABC-2 type transport system ATP-binding protein